jgi:tetratricopeptide (TPR) repeat protein
MKRMFFTVLVICAVYVGTFAEGSAETGKKANTNTNADAIIRKGINYYERGDYDKAIAEFTAALNIQPNHIIAIISRGTSYYNKGDYDQAIIDYTSALRIEPNYAPSFLARGITYNRIGDYNKAIDDFNAALRIEPGNADAKSNLAKAETMIANATRNDTLNSSVTITQVQQQQGSTNTANTQNNPLANTTFISVYDGQTFTLIFGETKVS